MKKKRFMKLLALASCVTLLTGCESEAFFGLGKYANKIADWGVGLLEKLGLKEAEKKEEKGSEDKPSGGGEQGGEQGGQEGGQEGGGQEGGGEETPKDPSIDVVGLPENMFIGEKLNLDEYVTVENAESFEVELASGSDEVASLEGHVLTFIGEGTCEFTVSAGEASEDCSLTVYSFLRSLYYNSFKDIGNHYTVYGYDYYQDEDTGEYVDYLCSIIYHSDNYIFEEFFDKDGADDGNMGLLTFTGKNCYSFEVSANETTGDPEVVLDEKYSALTFNAYNPAEFDALYYFGYYADVQWSAQTGETLVLEGNYASWFAEETIFGMDLKDNEGVTYTYSKIVLGAVDVSDENATEPEYVFYGTAYVSPEDSETLYFQLYFEFDLEDYGVDFLESYCVPENAPPTTDYYNDYFENHVLSDYLLSDAVTSVLGSSGYISYSFGCTDGTMTPIDQPDGSFYDSYYGAKLAVGSGVTVCGQNSVWELDENDNIADGFMKTESGVFYAAPTGNEYYTQAVAQYNSPWDSAIGFAGLRNAQNWPEDVFSGVAVDDESNPTKVTFSLESGQYFELFQVLMTGVGNEGILDFISFFRTKYSIDFFPYFSTSLTIDLVNHTASFLSYMTWSANLFYVVQINMVASDAVADMVAGFEAEVAPFCASN